MSYPLSKSERWDALRACWLDLQEPQLRWETETAFSRELHRRHAAALARLVADGDLENGVAERMNAAFGEAVSHVQKTHVRCYFALPLEFEPRANLTAQIAALAESAARSEIDPDTVARAQDSLARDIAWLAQFAAGREPRELAGINVSPIEIKAAHILSALLSGKRSDEGAQESRLTSTDAEAGHRQALRACWLALKDPLLESRDGDKLADDLRRRHEDAVTALTGLGLQPDVAEQIRAAFEEAVVHVRARMVLCYAVVPAAAEPRGDLVAQAAVLAEMAESAAIDPETVARAQQSLVRDIAWLSQARARQQPWKQETVEASPAEAAASAILVELLLGRN